jgi:DNA-binding XRE family transcriptional regulator
MKNVYFKLKALRVEYDYTQEEIGKLLSIHEATYNRKELGLNKFSLDEALSLSELFNLPVETVFFRN